MPTAVVNDRRIHYLDEGVGDDIVVFVHEFPFSGAMFQPQIRALSDRFRCIAPDLPGLGRSVGTDDPDAYSVESWADDLIALLARLGIDRTQLVGTSLGGDIALAMVRRDRERVGGLLLSGVRPGPTSFDDDRRWADQAEWIAGGGELDAIIDHAVGDKIAADAATRSESIKQLRAMVDQASRAGWVGGLRALRGRPDPLPDLDKIDVLTLIVAGSEDPVVSEDEAWELASRIPDAGVITIERAAHLPNMENPEPFTTAVEDLLAGRAPRRQTGQHSWPASPPPSPG